MTMRKNIKRWMWRMAGIGALIVVTGCHSEGTVTVRSPAVYVEDVCCVVPSYGYTVEVLVTDRDGYGISGSEVELVVAAVPERRYLGYTRSDGVVVFEVDAPPDVVAIAYACAPGFSCNASDVGIRADQSWFSIHVIL